MHAFRAAIRCGEFDTIETIFTEDVTIGDRALMFKASVNDLEIQACDFLHARADGVIDEITVMRRPLNAVYVFAEKMGIELEKPWHARA